MKTKIIKLVLAASAIPIEIFGIIGGGGCKQINYPSPLGSGTFGVVNNNSSFQYNRDTCIIRAKSLNDLANNCNYKFTNFRQLSHNNPIIFSAQTADAAKPSPTIKFTLIDKQNEQKIILENIQSRKNSKITIDLGQLKISPFLVKLDPNKMQPSFGKTYEYIKKNPVSALLPSFGILKWYLDFTINANQTITIDHLRLQLQYREPQAGCAKKNFMYTLSNNDLKKYRIIE